LPASTGLPRINTGRQKSRSAFFVRDLPANAEPDASVADRRSNVAASPQFFLQKRFTARATPCPFFERPAKPDVDRRLENYPQITHSFPP
jgi:hypothetical protein